MRKIVVIGGGVEPGEWDILQIDKKIVKLVKKKKPKVLFISTASVDNDGYIKMFQKIYRDKLGCQMDLLLLIKNKDSLTKQEIEKKILTADIVYVGDGNTLLMLKIWRKFGVDKLLKIAYRKGIILAGLSAGAICWFRYGISDAVKNPQDEKLFGRVKGLDMIPVGKSICLSPHHIREKEIRDKSIREIMLRTPGICLAVDDKTALFIYDEISSRTKKKILKYEIWRAEKNLGITKYFQVNERIKKERVLKRGVLEEV